MSSERSLRLGLLGGTFDPPHLGHLWLAETALDQLHLDQVLFLPVGQPPHKDNRPVTAATHRLAMTEAAISGQPAFTIDHTDTERPPPHATYSLLPRLRQRYAAAQFWLLLGSDSLRDLPQWQQPQRILPQTRLAVLPRPGVAVDWDMVETAVPGTKAAVDWLDGPQVAISSTTIRQWAAAHSIRYLVPKAVFTYIRRHSLYRP